jgi:hypothetical protein
MRPSAPRFTESRSSANGGLAQYRNRCSRLTIDTQLGNRERNAHARFNRKTTVFPREHVCGGSGVEQHRGAICSAGSFFPSGMECPPLVVTPTESLSGSGVARRGAGHIDLPLINGTTFSAAYRSRRFPSCRDAHFGLGFGVGFAACVCMADAWAARIVRTLTFIAPRSFYRLAYSFFPRAHPVNT